MRRFLVLVASLLGCAPSAPKLSTFSLPVEGKSLAVRAGSVELLRGTSSGQAYAQAAVRSARARHEMQFGSWKITDGNQAWTEAKDFAWDTMSTELAKGSYRDSAGTVVVGVEARATEDALALTFTAKDPAMNRLSLASQSRLPSVAGQASPPS